MGMSYEPESPDEPEAQTDAEVQDEPEGAFLDVTAFHHQRPPPAGGPWSIGRRSDPRSVGREAHARLMRSRVHPYMKVPHEPEAQDEQEVQADAEVQDEPEDSIHQDNVIAVDDPYEEDQQMPEF